MDLPRWITLFTAGIVPSVSLFTAAIIAYGLGTAQRSIPILLLDTTNDDIRAAMSDRSAHITKATQELSQAGPLIAQATRRGAPWEALHVTTTRRDQVAAWIATCSIQPNLMPTEVKEDD
jgi:hypothetical protein